MQRKHDEAKIRGNIGVGRSTNRSLAQLLTNKRETSAFRTFLQSEFSEENLNFWLDCESFKQIKPNKIRKVAAKIYEQYLEVGSPNEINIDAKTRDLIQSNLANPNIEIFNQAQSRIFKLMESDSFRRFRLKAA
uniref:RGS domain-containing protein n=1 Tax=Ciona savignyi TaxID=51511 RepID=H2YFP8_CIOSA